VEGGFCGYHVQLVMSLRDFSLYLHIPDVAICDRRSFPWMDYVDDLSRRLCH
jgi:hypothetical protein